MIAPTETALSYYRANCELETDVDGEKPYGRQLSSDARQNGFD